MLDLSPERFGTYISYAMCLEYLGIHLVKVESKEIDTPLTGNMKEDMVNAYIEKMLGKEHIMVYKFSVPERSELVVDDSVVQELIGEMPTQSSEDLIEILKYIMREKAIPLLAGDGDDIIPYEVYSEHLNQRVKLTVKVRKNDIWDNNKSQKMIKILTKSIFKNFS